MRRISTGIFALLIALCVSPAAFAATPNVVSGWVVDANGEGVVGAEVHLFDAPKVEGAETLDSISATTSGFDGWFAVPLPITSAYVTAANANGGQVNFDLVADAGSFFTFLGLSRQPDTTGNAWLAEDFSGTEIASFAAAGPLSPMREASALPVTVVLEGNPARVQAAAAELDAETAAAAVGPCKTVTSNVAATNVNGVVGQLHVERDTRAWWKYGQVADSDVGIGYSTSGTGNWSIKGSVHVGTNRSATTGIEYSTLNSGTRFGKKFKTSFRVVKRKHKKVCSPPIYDKTWYTVRAKQWNGGAAWGEDQSTWNNRCADQYAANAATWPANGTFDRTDSNFTKYTLGISAYGVNLWTQSGASQYVHLHWRFGNDYSTYWLCGSTKPPTTAGRIYAGA